jgi:hypothetical protein
MRPSPPTGVTHTQFRTLEVHGRRGYYYGDDPETLFTYDFINDLAYVLRPTTDRIVERAL